MTDIETEYQNYLKGEEDMFWTLVLKLSLKISYNMTQSRPHIDYQDVATDAVAYLYRYDYIAQYDVTRCRVIKGYIGVCLQGIIWNLIAGSKKVQFERSLVSYDLFDKKGDKDTDLKSIASLEYYDEDPLVREDNKAQYEDDKDFLIAHLTPLERKVLELHLEGKSACEIYTKLDISMKSQDNCMQRICQKARSLEHNNTIQNYAKAGRVKSIRRRDYCTPEEQKFKKMEYNRAYQKLKMEKKNAIKLPD